MQEGAQEHEQVNDTVQQTNILGYQKISDIFITILSVDKTLELLYFCLECIKILILKIIIFNIFWVTGEMCNV